jgi:hypothetical protein
VFDDRYHVTMLRTPSQVRAAINYCLNNWRHHRIDRGARGLAIDPFSSGHRFDGWREGMRPRQRDDDLPVCPPSTWLLAIGWRRAGSISAWSVPGR